MDYRCKSEDFCVDKSVPSSKCGKCEHLISVKFVASPTKDVPIFEGGLESLAAFVPNVFEKPEQAKRYNEGKPQWSLVNYKSLEPMVRVLEFGCEKYDRDNWKKGMPTHKILESMQRHLAALMDGEQFDSETGISHMGHIQANAMFYNYHTKNGEIESEI